MGIIIAEHAMARVKLLGHQTPLHIDDCTIETIGGGFVRVSGVDTRLVDDDYFEPTTTTSSSTTSSQTRNFGRVVHSSAVEWLETTSADDMTTLKEIIVATQETD